MQELTGNELSPLMALRSGCCNLHNGVLHLPLLQQLIVNEC